MTALLLLLSAAAIRTAEVLPPHKTVMPLSIRYLPPRQPSGGAGQQSTDPAPESPPPRPAPRLFQPPQLAASDPLLPVRVLLAEDPGLSVQMAGVGDVIGIPGNGGTGLTGLTGPPGDRGGRGDGPGDGDGNGFTDFKSTVKVTRPPELIYKEEPEYSEDARKAHVQGTVRLHIEVGLDGRATNIRLVRGVGLGLDENAIEAVRKWRFRPALSGDRPVVAPAVIDVGFFLL